MVEVDGELSRVRFRLTPEVKHMSYHDYDSVQLILRNITRHCPLITKLYRYHHSKTDIEMFEGHTK